MSARQLVLADSITEQPCTSGLRYQSSPCSQQEEKVSNIPLTSTPQSKRQESCFLRFLSQYLRSSSACSLCSPNIVLWVGEGVRCCSAHVSGRGELLILLLNTFLLLLYYYNIVNSFMKDMYNLTLEPPGQWPKVYTHKSSYKIIIRSYYFLLFSS